MAGAGPVMYKQQNFLTFQKDMASGIGCLLCVACMRRYCEALEVQGSRCCGSHTWCPCTGSVEVSRRTASEGLVLDVKPIAGPLHATTG